MLAEKNKELLLRGNHKSAAKHATVLTDILDKEVCQGWMFPVPISSVSKFLVAKSHLLVSMTNNLRCCRMVNYITCTRTAYSCSVKMKNKDELDELIRVCCRVETGQSLSNWINPARI